MSSSANEHPVPVSFHVIDPRCTPLCPGLDGCKLVSLPILKHCRVSSSCDGVVASAVGQVHVNASSRNSDHREIIEECSKIPKLLHLVWLGCDRSMPKYVMKHLNSWRTLLSAEWKVRLWTEADLYENEDLDRLTLSRIRETNIGAQKADILRYRVLWKHGGVYVDCDMEPFTSLDVLLEAFPLYEVLLCTETAFDVTWAYLTNAFLAAVPNSLIMQAACHHVCHVARLNLQNEVHLETGPRCLGQSLVVATVEQQSTWKEGKQQQEQALEKRLLLPTHWFYRAKGVGFDRNQVIANHLWKASWTCDKGKHRAEKKRLHKQLLSPAFQHNKTGVVLIEEDPRSTLSNGCLVRKSIDKREDLGSLLNLLQFKSGIVQGVGEGCFAKSLLENWRCCNRLEVVFDEWRHLPEYRYTDCQNWTDEQYQSKFDTMKGRLDPWIADNVVRVHNGQCFSLENHVEPADFVYLESKHDYNSLQQQLELHWQLLNKGGIMAGKNFLDSDEHLQYNPGDDWRVQWDGTVRTDNKAVKSAVADFVKAKYPSSLDSSSRSSTTRLEDTKSADDSHNRPQPVVHVTVQDGPWISWFFFKQ